MVLSRWSVTTEKNHKKHKKKMPNCRKCQLGDNYGA